MNFQAYMSLLKQVITFGGGLLAGMGVATAEQVHTAASNLEVLVPAAFSLASILWSVYSHWRMKKVPQ